MLNEPELTTGKALPWRGTSADGETMARIQKIIAEHRASGRNRGSSSNEITCDSAAPETDPVEGGADRTGSVNHLQKQLAELASGSTQNRYVVDCSALGINDMDGEESVSALIGFWKRLDSPRGKIVIRNASDQLRGSLKTKNLLNGIFTPELPETGTAEEPAEE